MAWALVQDQLPANVPEKAAEHCPHVSTPSSTWETQAESQAPSFRLTNFQALQSFERVNQWKDALFLSLVSLFITLLFK